MLNCLLYILYATFHISTSKYYQYSDNIRDSLKQKSARSCVTYWVTYIYAMCKRWTIRCYDNPKLYNDHNMSFKKFLYI
jgi:hypothetical protein